MKSEKLYDCDRVAKEWAAHYVNNSAVFMELSMQKRGEIIDDIKNMMVSLCVFYENK